MTDNNTQGIVKRRGLTQEELGQIEELANLCNACERLDLKLNWNTLRSRPTDKTNDFLYYEHGQLVGYLPLFSFNSQEAEVSGMVHPNFRRLGIFTALLQEAQAECRQRGIARILLIVEQASSSGQAFVKQLPVRYDHSEYKMVLQEARMPATVNTQLHFRPAQAEDVAALAHITALAFNMPEQEVDWYTVNVMSNSNRRYYVGVLDNTIIGKIDVVFQQQEAIIYGFGVLPEYRGKGYGRQMLAQTIRAIQATGQSHVALEVATENKNALSLYQSCGFLETSAYDYYVLLG